MNNEWKMCKRKNRYKDEHTVNYYRKVFEKEREKNLTITGVNVATDFI